MFHIIILICSQIITQTSQRYIFSSKDYTEHVLFNIIYIMRSSQYNHKVYVPPTGAKNSLIN